MSEASCPSALRRVLCTQSYNEQAGLLSDRTVSLLQRVQNAAGRVETSSSLLTPSFLIPVNLSTSSLVTRFDIRNPEHASVERHLHRPYTATRLGRESPGLTTVYRRVDQKDALSIDALDEDRELTVSGVVTRSCKSDHITPTLRDLQLLGIRKRMAYKILIIIYLAYNGSGPGYLVKLIQLGPKLCSAIENKLHIPSIKFASFSHQTFFRLQDKHCGVEFPCMLCVMLTLCLSLKAC